MAQGTYREFDPVAAIDSVRENRHQHTNSAKGLQHATLKSVWDVAGGYQPQAISGVTWNPATEQFTGDELQVE